MKDNFREKLILSIHADGTSKREGADARLKAAQHQQTPIYELNSTKLSDHKGPRPEGYSVRDQYINPLRRKKGLPEVK